MSSSLARCHFPSPPLLEIVAKLVDRYSCAGAGTGQGGGADHGGEEFLGEEVAGVKGGPAAQHAKDAEDTQDCSYEN